MREEVLAKMEAVRANPSEAGIPTDFQFEALKVPTHVPAQVKRLCAKLGGSWMHCAISRGRFEM